jgi:transposase-like protein
MDKAPDTLLEAVQFFSVYENCHAFMVNLRWPNGKVTCPRCGSENVSYLPNAKVFKCYEKHDRQKFSLKVGTIFEDSPIALEKWLPVVWLIVNAKNGVSSWEIHRAIGVTQKTAWFMLQRVRLAMQDDLSGGALAGEVEIDETFTKRTIGGTYVSVEPFHLFRYVDEQAFRYNNRDMNDGLRFRWAMRHIVNRRLTYAELTGKTAAPENRPTEATEPF